MSPSDEVETEKKGSVLNDAVEEDIKGDIKEDTKEDTKESLVEESTTAVAELRFGKGSDEVASGELEDVAAHANDRVIRDGYDVSEYLLPIRDDGDPALTFRSILLGLAGGAFNAVINQIYTVSLEIRYELEYTL
jgi:hypothetical protein